MIAVDASAMVAIVFGEPERKDFKSALVRAGRALISTVSVLETRIVVHSRRGERGVVLLDSLLSLPTIEAIAPGPREIEIAYGAFIAFGRGSGHPAALNFGDLFSYALAKARGIPLLFKGEDFGHTDVEVVALTGDPTLAR